MSWTSHSSSRYPDLVWHPYNLRLAANCLVGSQFNFGTHTHTFTHTPHTHTKITFLLVAWALDTAGFFVPMTPPFHDEMTHLSNPPDFFTCSEVTKCPALWVRGQTIRCVGRVILWDLLHLSCFNHIKLMFPSILHSRSVRCTHLLLLVGVLCSYR